MKRLEVRLPDHLHKWLWQQKGPGKSINSIIVEALEEKRERDEDAGAGQD